MAKKIQISVPVPCHEDWEAMTTVEKGKFCGSCQKQVVDFSNMSDREIAQFFKKPSTGSVCGRFMNDQLDRDIEIPKKRIPFVKYLFNLLLPAFLLTKLSAQKTIGKVIPPQSRDTIPQKATNELITLGMIMPTEIQPVIGDTVCVKPTQIQKNVDAAIIDDRKMVSGIVTDEASNPIPGASVIIKGVRNGVATNQQGYFKLSAKLGDKIIVTGIDIDPTEVTVGTIDTIQIFIRRAQVTTGIIVTKIVEKAKETSIPLIENKAGVDSASGFQLYPNPAKPGSDITINWIEKEEGYYSFLLMNQAGQSVQQKEIWIDADARQLNLPLPSVAAGNYFVVLVNKKSGKRFSEKIIIR
ncbi:MAG TPA: carboxypeptidase-like regulatory domain-containing protein [Chitinophagaceae bacterium]|nr:carboxypeptidase-like regulatory domain-containing protein [Chitinophagaceae bacterium]